MILASEDIGEADPTALPIAVAAAQATQLVGLPEAGIILAQAVIHCALAPKSNAVVAALGAGPGGRQGRAGRPGAGAPARRALRRRPADRPRQGLPVRARLPRRRRRPAVRAGRGRRPGLLRAQRPRRRAGCDRPARPAARDPARRRGRPTHGERQRIGRAGEPFGRAAPERPPKFGFCWRSGKESAKYTTTAPVRPHRPAPAVAHPVRGARLRTAPAHHGRAAVLSPVPYGRTTVAPTISSADHALSAVLGAPR